LSKRLATRLLADLQTDLEYVRDVRKSYEQRIKELDRREAEILEGLALIRKDTEEDD
jgi:hypothetical protein